MSNEYIYHKHYGSSGWMDCTLCRSHLQSAAVLKKAKRRQIEWPQPRHDSQQSGVQDPLVYTSLDDAFAKVLYGIGVSSKQCKRYYRSSVGSCMNKSDRQHCDRFHTPHYTKVMHKNPLQSSETVHVMVEPGSYAVTAGESTTQQTHLVHMHPGHSVNLDFVI